MMRNDSPKIRRLSLHINEKIQKNQPVDSGRAPCNIDDFFKIEKVK